MIRVLVAEDSPTARALLVAMISSASGLEVVGEAKDGLEAIDMARQLKPDVITMDIQMPRLDGFEATKRIMTECPTPIVIISSLDVHSVEISMEALRAGALAVLPKPVGPSDPSYDQAARFVAVTVRSMSQVKLVRRWPDSPPYRGGTPAATAAAPSAGQPAAPAPAFAAVRPRIVAIAASTGGPAALQTIFGALPADFPVPIVFVQHIALGFAEGFATWLDESSPLRVKVARAGEPLRPGTAYLAPDDQHLTISERATVVLSSDPPVGSFRPSGNVLFESAATVFGSSVIGAILTGMGNEGVEGLRKIKAAGGRIVAQDEATSVIFGMPGSAVAAGLPDFVLPLTLIAPHLRRLTSG